MSLFVETIRNFLGPVLKYLDDESVSEILINGANEVFIEKKGVLESVPEKFTDEQALQAAVRNIAQYVGRRIDEENPILDARLPDGSRISAVFPPCSRKGTILSIRKFSKRAMTFTDLIKHGGISKDGARFLDICVFLAKNMIVSGGTGSGKTTFLNVLGGRVPPKQRILIVEDSSELNIKSDHIVFFETKPNGPDGKGEITMRDLLRSALRLRPDRIIVGEVRGPEALDLITAMNTGHGGSMGTIHANSPYDALVRLETLALMGDTRVPTEAIRRQITGAIHIIVQCHRFSDGTRRVTHISEVNSTAGRSESQSGQYQINDIFRFVQRGKSADGKVIGEFVATGYVPSFITEIEVNRIPFGREHFAAPDWLKRSA